MGRLGRRGRGAVPELPEIRERVSVGISGLRGVERDRAADDPAERRVGDGHGRAVDPNGHDLDPECLLVADYPVIHPHGHIPGADVAPRGDGAQTVGSRTVLPHRYERGPRHEKEGERAAGVALRGQGLVRAGSIGDDDVRRRVHPQQGKNLNVQRPVTPEDPVRNPDHRPRAADVRDLRRHADASDTGPVPAVHGFHRHVARSRYLGEDEGLTVAVGRVDLELPGRSLDHRDGAQRVEPRCVIDGTSIGDSIRVEPIDRVDVRIRVILRRAAMGPERGEVPTGHGREPNRWRPELHGGGDLTELVQPRRPSKFTGRYEIRGVKFRRIPAVGRREILEPHMVLEVSPGHGPIRHDQVDVVAEDVETRVGGRSPVAVRSTRMGIAALKGAILVVLGVQPDRDGRRAGRIHDVGIGVDAVAVRVEVDVLSVRRGGAEQRGAEEERRRHRESREE